MVKNKLRFCLSCLVVAAVALVPLLAMEPTPIPNTLHLTSLDGQTVNSDHLPNQGNWLLFYVNPQSHFSDEMLRVLQKGLNPNSVASAVIIVGGTLDDLKTFRAKYPDLGGAVWYADTNRDAFTQLKLHGVPVVVGVRDQTMRWAVNGMLPDAASFKAMVNSWVEQRPPAKAS